MSISIVIPARNEIEGLRGLLPRLSAQCPGVEILVVDDGSTDGTGDLARAAGARVIRHPYPKGNGAAVKTGARNATGDILVFMDADGQHDPADIPRLLAGIDGGADMAVGARRMASQAGAHRALANGFYNRLAGWMVNHRVEDLTSGFRAVRARLFRRFLPLLPNSFSYPTTITMCFFRAGFNVGYVPIVAAPRIGKSHIRLFRDGVRFLLIIFKIGTLYSPLKLFLPISGAFFVGGLGLYLFNYLASQRFTNMSALLLSVSVLVFLIGLVSEQITTLMFKDSEQD
ncbi:MAG: glycosyltransferase family 2 protein [Candidatus Nitricoxidivorans perseverans]|uniref:Glycosyltransferase family 2 protein n=1 Tax=Candidatus Nitricoxidivorans perseverans TaxID=2975601 RepID=A0AA49FK82_9PROT|nr:MAG: glycosyltransferase family 2 protein [Candidatus Nitricoxidivorans perseverans]